MTADRLAITIAYLAPEIPALSETFVYEEIHGVERLGFRVVPISLRRSARPPTDQQALAARVAVLYARGGFWLILTGLLQAPLFGTRLLSALRCLISDLLACGVHRLNSWKLAYQFFGAIRLARILQRENCVHLHVHFAHTPAQVAMYASLLSGVPFTITAHANDIFERGLLLPQKAERALRLLTISEHNRQYLESLGIPKDRLAVVRCGVSLVARARAERPAGGRFIIGTLGRMVEKKGFDVLFRAVALLKDWRYPIELRIAGDGPLQEELLRLAAALGITDITRFDGSLPHHRVADWLHELDTFVLACKVSKAGDMDGIPVVLMEAMSQSVSVVSTRISGIPELVRHEETGLLAQPDDIDDLAQQIERLIESGELRAKLAARACDYVMDEFGQKRNLDRLLSAFGLPGRKALRGANDLPATVNP